MTDQRAVNARFARIIAHELWREAVERLLQTLKQMF